MGTNFQIVCANCAAFNRVPQARLGEAPKCGKCHAQLFSGTLLELNDGNFQKAVNGSSQLLLVMFWAPWCGYCQKTLPAFKQAALHLEPYFRLATINTESSRGNPGRLGINSLPTLAVFKSGQELARQPGALTTEQIVSWARSVSAGQ